MIILETERLLHRRLEEKDVETIINFRSDADVSKFIGGEKAQSREFNESRMEFYLDCWEKYGFGFAMMIIKETGEEIGWSGLQPLEKTGEIEVGYGFIKKYWKQGFGFETAQGWLKYGFENTELDKIVAVAAPENFGSWRIMEKCGMTRDGIARHYDSDVFHYTIKRDDYFRNKKTLDPAI